MSTGYRFYLLEHGDHIAAVKACECTTDADALLEADAVLPLEIGQIVPPDSEKLNHALAWR